MRAEHHNRSTDGFTLIELIVVVAVMAVLTGSLVPLLSATREAERIGMVQDELEVLDDALEAYYFDQGRFPAALDAPGFYGVYVLPGINDDGLRDEWGTQGLYQFGVSTTNPDVAIVYSVGENGRDDGFANETYKLEVYGAEPGARRTRQRMRVIVGVYAQYLDAGNRPTGVWTDDRQAMGLGADYQTDGFGTDFTLDEYVLRSAGADRVLNTSDDLVL